MSNEELGTTGTEQQTGDGTGAATPDAGTPPFTPEQQAQVDHIIGERLKRARTQWDEEQAAAQKKAAEKAEAERLKAQQEYKALAEKAEARVAELEPLGEQIKGYEELISELLQAKISELGERAQAAVDNLPGKPGALDKLRWLNANAALFTAKTPPPATDSTARGTGGPQPTDEQIQEFAARMGVDPKYVDARLLVVPGG